MTKNKFKDINVFFNLYEFNLKIKEANNKDKVMEVKNLTQDSKVSDITSQISTQIKKDHKVTTTNVVVGERSNQQFDPYKKLRELKIFRFSKL